MTLSEAVAASTRIELASMSRTGPADDTLSQLSLFDAPAPIEPPSPPPVPRAPPRPARPWPHP